MKSYEIYRKTPRDIWPRREEASCRSILSLFWDLFVLEILFYGCLIDKIGGMYPITVSKELVALLTVKYFCLVWQEFTIITTSRLILIVIRPCQSSCCSASNRNLWSALAGEVRLMSQAMHGKSHTLLSLLWVSPVGVEENPSHKPYRYARLQAV